MKATQVLHDEHEGIIAMLAVVESAANRLQKGKEIPPEFMTNAVMFFRNFADRCHHAKEEEKLFPALVARGIPKEGGPVEMMLIEHNQGRALILTMEEAAGRYAAGDASAGPDLVQGSLGYASLLRAHIFKEDNVLFPMADSILSEAEQRELFESTLKKIQAEAQTKPRPH